MIVTLTANPSIDRTVLLTDRLTRGAVQRAADSVTDPGGKGINVARVLTAAGIATTATLPGSADDPLLSALRGIGITHRTVRVAGRSRTNLTITEPDGTTTKINEAGNPLSAADQAHLAELLLELAVAARWIVLAGSVPPGVPDEWYAELVEALRTLPVKIAVDTSDGPLTALAARFPAAAPDLLKPNAEELAQLTGFDANAMEEAAARADPTLAAAAAARLVERGAGAVLATLGAAGAVLVTTAGAWYATPPPTVVKSTVGAGDSSLAGYLLADLAEAEPAAKLAHAVAYGAAAAALPGTELPTPDHLDLTHTAIHPLPSTVRTQR